MSTITRHGTNARLSRIVVHERTAYLAGLTATERSGDAQAQAAEIFGKVDELLASIGTDKTRILSTQIWVADMERDFAAMNRAWEAWMPQGHAPARATCEAKLASPEIRVEVIVTAALGA
ncbi:MAG TPA: RidA family protein [Paraburkholderia sp.]|jgi:enamine deaminase RidA (YjgF/YER057c/UK114 family)|nr:RidA family protein [Paraburkholderia sp.]